MELESSRPDGPLTVGRQLNIKTKPITERRIVVLLATTSLFATIAALEACLVKLGQEQLGAAAARCRQQAKPHGFAGNPDVYGLGIRLGLYFQWIGSLTANFFLARERRPTLAAFVVFNLSIAIAVLVLVFRHACAFTAEMYIVFTMFWGGVNAIGFPVIDVERTVKWIRKGEKAPPRPLSTPNAFSLGLNVLMFPVTIWYWIRLAMVGERDFAATPGGTALFFFTKMQGSDIRPVSIYLAIMSILVFLWLIINLVPNFAGEDHADRLLDTFTCVFYSPLILIYSIHLIPVTFLVGMPTVYLSSACKRVAIGFRVLFKGEAISKAVSTYIDSLDLSAMLSNSVLVTVTKNLVPSGIMIWCILSIELTLKWNSVTNVYNVSTTGQVIPLVGGICVLGSTLWKMRQRSLDDHDASLLPTERLRSRPPGAFQLEDGTWR